MKILVLFIIKFIIKAQSMKYVDYPLLGAFNCLFEFDVIQLWVVLCLEFRIYCGWYSDLIEILTLWMMLILVALYPAIDSGVWSICLVVVIQDVSVEG